MRSSIKLGLVLEPRQAVCKMTRIQVLPARGKYKLYLLYMEYEEPLLIEMTPTQ